LFDHSWSNRADVERVMGFCTEKQVVAFFKWRDDIFEATDTEYSPWFAANAKNK
jgi:polyphosphate kinase 2 (PPK2 family)